VVPILIRYHNPKELGGQFSPPHLSEKLLDTIRPRVLMSAVASGFAALATFSLHDMPHLSAGKAANDAA
jgi:hypothetical protein